MAAINGLEINTRKPSTFSLSQQTEALSGTKNLMPEMGMLPGTSEEGSESNLLSDTESTDGNVSCRICKHNGGDDLVTSPCHCKGTMGWVHVTCLEEWLTGSIRDSCELCSCPFTIVRKPKYGYLQSIWIFMHTRISFFRLLRDLFYLTISLVNTCILMYMWLTYVFREALVVLEDKSHLSKLSEVNPRFLMSPLRICIYFFVFTMCLVFVSLNAVDDFRRIFYFYFLPWYHWWKQSVEIKLVINGTTKPKNQ